jgi:hypothetical protein
MVATECIYVKAGMQDTHDEEKRSLDMSVSKKMGGIKMEEINAKDFGAVGDGVTTDTKAIQSDSPTNVAVPSATNVVTDIINQTATG